ncbi:MAG: rhodanese-like domain-containing protein [Gammaproteobacteria bacterium]|nr:rhodanese-like domain-containing protein [Gammaproteobacteria bacterium]
MTRFLPMTILLPALAGSVLSGCSEPTGFDRTGAAAALAKTIATEGDHVTVAELSDWIIKDRRDFTLLDIRDAGDFAAGHIDGARNVPLAGLMADASLDALPGGRKVVVYSNGTAHAAQAALLLRLVERDAYALLGGFNHWQAYLNDPQVAGVAAMDPKQRAAYQAVACRFAGDYVAAAGLTPQAAASAPAPAPAAPAADPLGLGLGLGLGSPAVQQAAPAAAPAAPAADPLGLGLGLGLGSDEVKGAQPPAAAPPASGRLLIKAEC